jgi:serine/threonine-protein kinase
MEFLQGKSLRRWLQQKQRIDFVSTVRVLSLVAAALHHAHRITIHRDLSPENIMVLPDGSIRIFDFGLAKLDDEFKNLTMVGANLGKMKYMAPEQELNAADVDHRADLYSLGVIFFEMLTGGVPLPGQRITELRPDLPPEADLFMVKALARDPDRRFASAREFYEGLVHLYRTYKTRQETATTPQPARPAPPAAAPEAAPPRSVLVRTRAFLRRMLRGETT